MKFAAALILIALAFTVQAYAGGTPAPGDDKCNQPKFRKAFERTIVADLRKSAESMDTTAFSFHFTNVWRYKGVADLLVYFEVVSSNLSDRHGYTAQYNIDPKTCAVKPQLKIARMYTEEELKILPPSTEDCNDTQKSSELRQALRTMIEDLYPQINPGEIMGNYTFSTVERQAGTSDISVFVERTVPGLISRPSVVQFSIEPKTCKPSMKRGTGITAYQED